ncbi:MAG: hypothetical protein GEV11_12150 [Streptosporangiales bacterium]|nr:hypothetical protein [Streptosporangiales bacterium]
MCTLDTGREGPVLARVPGVFLLVGAGAPGGPRYPHHHPRFDLDEDALTVGVEALLVTVLGLCGREGGGWTIPPPM